jgi:hypothetical protein
MAGFSQVIVRAFQYNAVNYEVVLVPDTYPEEGGLDFTGNYHGILISEEKGTKTFELIPDTHSRWETDPKSMDPGLIDEFDKIIKEFRAGK